MGVLVNQALLNDEPVDEAGNPVLPMGVYPSEEWAGYEQTKSGPALERVKLFEVNGRAYTAPKAFDNRVMFRYMRAVRKNKGDDIAPVADLMYDVLGDAVMDCLADEQLTESEFSQVMKVVEKHTAGVAQRALGK
jgi:hypothetical protein